MTFSFARVGAAVGMRVEDYFADASAGGCASTKKAARSMRCRRITTSKPISTPTCVRRDSFGAKGTPLFRSADWHGGALTNLPMHRIDVRRMIRRRAEKAGIDADMCCHTFRATGLTNFLANGGTLENAQACTNMPARARRSSMTALATRSRLTRSKELRFSRVSGGVLRLSSASCKPLMFQARPYATQG